MGGLFYGIFAFLSLKGIFEKLVITINVVLDFEKPKILEKRPPKVVILFKKMVLFLIFIQFEEKYSYFNFFQKYGPIDKLIPFFGYSIINILVWHCQN